MLNVQWLIFKCLCERLLFKMTISCAYPGCCNIKKPKRKFSLGKKIVTFHRFPISDPERLKLWLLALLLDINSPKHALIFKRVCSDHFIEDDFKPSQQGNRRCLKASAVPNTVLKRTEVCMVFYYIRVRMFLYYLCLTITRCVKMYFLLLSLRLEEI